MRNKDIKLLWGRSGNRCAICKIELTPDGENETIGEIAHIIGESFNGPRGDDQLPLSERNDYSNLLLLCPNHHSEIDKLPEKWSAEKLRQIKSEHEIWVSNKLENGSISIKPIDNSNFLTKINVNWLDFSQSRIWIATSLTPLLVEEYCINTLAEKVIDAINNISLPNDAFWNLNINKYDTRPNENGILNQKLNKIDEGIGYKIQIFRNGHCEFLFCLDAYVNQVSDYANKYDFDKIKSCRVIRYTDLAEIIINQINELKNVWKSCLPFKDMTLIVEILNSKNTILYSKEKGRNGTVYGFPVDSEKLIFSSVINRNSDTDEIIKDALVRFVNYFGLILDKVYDNQKEFERPHKLQM